MRVILHPGAHCTDEGRLIKCLLSNADRFLSRGVVVPPPGRYRQILPSVLVQLEGADPSEDARDVMFDLLIDEDPGSVDRVLLSHENLFCMPKLALSGGRFYRKAERRLEVMTRLFKGDQVELFLALRNPASFLPALIHASPFDALIELTGGFDPQRLLWSDLIARIRKAVPEVKITLWCNEDSPMIWAEIIRAMAGLQPNEKIIGGFTLLAEIMSQKGMKRFRNYLADHPGIDEEEKRMVMGAFLEEYAMDEAIEEELDLPGWTDAVVDNLTDIYERDVAKIAQMLGVRLIAP